jgi:hypothetical protein
LSTVTITDPDHGASEAVTLTVTGAGGAATDADGTLSGSGLSKTGTGTYTVTAGSPASVTAILDGLTFTPTAHQVAPGQSVTTGITLAVSNDGGAAVTNATTSIVATAANDTPVISGTKAGQTTTDYVPITPFATATISDPDAGAQDSLTISVITPSAVATDANGTLSGPGLSKNGVGHYTLAATSPAALTQELQSIVFTPTEGEVAAGKTVTTLFILGATQNGASSYDNTTSVTATALNYITGPALGLGTLNGASGQNVITAQGLANTIILPSAAGQGFDYINGFTLLNSDILNVSSALAAAGFNMVFDLLTLGNFLKVSDVNNTATLSIANGGSGAGVAIAQLNGISGLTLQTLQPHLIL